MSGAMEQNKSDFQAGKITAEQYMACLEASNEELKAKTTRKPTDLRIKVSAKGAASIYGLGRFPVTLYKSQWQRLLGYKESIEEFIVDHDSELASKD